MPELPEVETIKRDLAIIKGQKIVDVIVYDERVIKDIEKDDFRSKIRNSTISNIARRGKSLIFTLSNKGYMVVLLKMTGQLILGRNAKELKDTKASFKLSNGLFLNYNDQRVFGWLKYAENLDDVQYLKTIGPEPLDGSLPLNWYIDGMRKRKAPIKTLLMNQSFVAGIGNIYASEILFSAGIKPTKSSGKLSKREIKSLYSSVRQVLNEAIEYRGTSMRNYRDLSGKEGRFKNRIKVYGREHQECVICRSWIQRIVQSGRSTFFCSRCQK